jgi:NADPH-dependent 2,4-dienoyl-CoA reductase/sulfur reductase-like enzyme
MTKPVVIVGASLGGLRTAEALRRFGYAGAITIIGDETWAPYNRPPLSKEVLAGEEVSHETVVFPQKAATADVGWVLGRRVVSADLENCTITTDDGEVFEYSELIVATGLRPKRQVYPNNIHAGRHIIRTLDDAMGLRAALQPGARVVVLGAGFIGCETAATARKLGCEVTIVAPGTVPMLRPLGNDLAHELQRRQEAEGVQFLMKRSVADLVGSARIEALTLDDGTELPCDVFIEAIGSLPNTEWLEGNDIDVSDGLLCDQSLRGVRASGGSWSNVWGVGDVVRFPNPIFDDVPRRVEHWNIPSECAKYVGNAIATGSTEATFRPIPSFWSDQFDVHILAFGLLALADSNKLVEGSIDGDCVFEYYRGDQLVGAAGIGLRSVVQGYRKNFER